MGVGLFTLYALIALIALVYFYVKNRYEYWKKRNIPFDEPQFLFGSFYSRRKTGLYDMFKDLYDNNKGKIPFAGFFTFITPSVVLLDLDLIRNVLIKDFNIFDDRGIYFNEKADPISAHLVALNAPKWRTLRGKLTPTFTSGRMKMMFPIIGNAGEELVKALEQQIRIDSDVDTKDILSRFTTDVIGRCAFGIDCNSLKDPNNEFRKAATRMFSLDQTRLRLLFVEALPRLARFFNMKLLPRELSDFYTKIVVDTIEYRERNGVRRNDFMNLLIDLKNTKPTQVTNGAKVAALTMNEIVAQSFVFFNAGFETSSSTMNFALYELAQNPSLQERLRKEINSVLSRHRGEFTYEGIKEMTYLGQVISETLRIYAPTSTLRRVANAEYRTSDPNFIIPKDARIVIPIHSIHHDPAIYPDPQIFNPDRFSPEEVQKRHPMSWLAFGDGPRNCIGLRFAKMQTSLGLAILIKHFRFSVTRDTPIPMTFKLRARLLTPEKRIMLLVESI